MKLLNKIGIVTASLIVVLSYLLAPIPTYAERASITVTPSKRKISLQAGEDYRSTIKVSNLSEAEEDLNFKIYAQPFFYTNDEYTQVDYDTKGVYNKMVDWIKIDKSSGTVVPGGVDEIGFTISVPTDATAGGQYAAIVVEKVTPDFDATGNSLSVKDVHRVAMPIYAKIAGPTTESGKIKENNISSFFLKAPITASSLIENTGNVHADATYILKVYPLFSDEEIYTNEEDGGNQKLILPGTTRFATQEADAAKTGEIGIFRVEQEVRFLDQSSTTSKIVILCPMWLLLVIVFAIVFIVVWLVMRNKNRKAAAKGKTAGKSSKSTPTSSSTPSSRPSPSDTPESKPDTE